MLAKLGTQDPDGEADGSSNRSGTGSAASSFATVIDSNWSVRNLKPLGRYFPELTQPLLDALPSRCMHRWREIVVADVAGNGLDFDGLLQRIHPAKSRIDRLAAETPAEFVAFDHLGLKATRDRSSTVQ